ncbi:MAG: M23 family metallopeptidase [Lachnospiraceae bacterium]|jgi:murein DD-endopeptidase MepM/ murein hydrolase activator NlpD|nr:M23 family metallopeptidase [Lachnospiraceae bacterium]
MRRKKHTRKRNHVLIITSDATDTRLRQIRLNSRWLQAFILFLCIAIGAAAGYLYYAAKLWGTLETLQNDLSKLQTTNQNLIAEKEQQSKQDAIEIENLNDQVKKLTEEVDLAIQRETELAQLLEIQRVPTEFPLTSLASLEERLDGDPLIIFLATEGTMVVATAKGSVLAVNDDAEYGHNVWVDHGNGYVTVYRNQGTAVVEVGDSVAQGTTLFLMGEDNLTLGYQIMKDGSYINPMDVLEIKG